MGISKPTKVTFWIAFIMGAFAILNQYFFKLNIPIISSIPNMILLTIAFILLVAGVVFKKM